MKKKIVTLAVLSAFNSSAESLDWTISPSFSASGHYSDVLRDSINSHGSLSNTASTLDFSAIGNLHSTNGTVLWSTSSNSASDEKSNSYRNYKLSHSIGGRDRPWLINIERTHDENLYNQLTNSLVDDLYAELDGDTSTQTFASATYSYKQSDIDRTVSLNKSWKDFSSSFNSSNESSLDGSFSLSRMTGSHDIYWQGSISREERAGGRSNSDEYNNSIIDSKFHLPILNQWLFTGLLKDSEYSFESETESTNDRKHAEIGVGLTYIDNATGNYVTLGRSKDQEDDTYNWTLQSQAKFSDESSFLINLDRKFYGRSLNMEIEKKLGRSSVSLFSGTNIDFQYVSTGQSIFDGFVICPSGQIEADLVSCERPDGDVVLTPGMNLLPLFNIVYGLEPRLTRQEKEGIKVVWPFSKYTLESSYTKEVNINAGSQIDQKSSSAFISLENKLSERDSIFYSFTYRGIKPQNNTFDSVERLHRIGFKRQANRFSTWTISAHTLDKNSRNENLSLDDNRVSFIYTIHFGGKNKNRVQ